MDKKNKLLTLDLNAPVKLVAFLCIFLLHATIFGVGEWNAKPIAALVTTPAWAGVWIFFILSGYGISQGYIHNKYNITCSGILKFYFLRFMKIAPIYYLYLLVVIPLFAKELFTPTFSFSGIWKLLTFNYAEEFGSLYFGAVWFLSTLMKLYFISPLIYWLVERLNLKNSKKSTMICIVSILSFGLIMRLLGFYSVRTGDPNAWSPSIYKPFYMNLDLYITGFLAAYVHKFNTNKKTEKSVTFFVLLLFLIIINSCLLYIGSHSRISVDQNIKDNALFLYQYIFPTVYAITILFILSNKHVVSLPVCSITKSFNSMLNFYERRSLQIYLVHSNVFLLFQLIIQRWFLDTAINKPFTALVVLICLSVPTTIIITEIFYRITNFLFLALQKRCKDIEFTVYLDEDCCRNINKNYKKIEKSTAN